MDRHCHIQGNEKMMDYVIVALLCFSAGAVGFAAGMLVRHYWE